VLKPPRRGQQAFSPVVSVLDDGTVGVRYSDFRANEAAPGGRAVLDRRVHRPVPPGQAERLHEPGQLGSEVKLNDASYDMRQAPFARGWFVGDYVGMDNDGKDLLPFRPQPFGRIRRNAFVRRVGLVSSPNGPSPQPGSSSARDAPFELPRLAAGTGAADRARRAR
jgi:hypothetical protein